MSTKQWRVTLPRLYPVDSKPLERNGWYTSAETAEDAAREIARRTQSGYFGPINHHGVFDVQPWPCECTKADEAQRIVVTASEAKR